VQWAPVVDALREAAGNRLVQFLVLGGLLFLAAPGAPDDDRAVRLDSARIERLGQREATRRGLQGATRALRDEVRSRAVEDAVLLREARRLGLDQDDAIIRGRLIQKMLFIAEDLGGASRPLSEPDLRAFFAAHRDRYRQPPRLRFVHVFARGPERLEADRAAVLRFEAEHPGAIPPFGEGFPVGRRVDASAADLERRWGAGFAAAARSLPLGSWSGPIASSYGHHLVKVLAREPGRTASFDEVREKLRLDLLVARRADAVARFVARALARYEVTVDGQRVTALGPTGRVAVRTAPSAED
jgi:peptidyl-prolyl cis-trans isomerase C